MKLNRTGSNWNRLERNKINENWDIIEGSYNDVVGQITDEVVGHLIDSARLDWREPVDTVGDLPTNAEVGETRMVREADPDGISYVYRYDGEKWEKIQEIDVTLVNEVDSRLSAQLADTDSFRGNESMINRKRRRPMITIVDDDGNRGVYTKLYEFAKEYNIKFTSAMITGRPMGFPGDNRPYYNRYYHYNEVMEMNESGLIEFISHTHSHDINHRLEDMTEEERLTDMRLSQEFLKRFGLNYHAMAYPFGSYTQDVVETARQVWDYCIGTGTRGDEIVLAPFDNYDMRRSNGQAGVERVKSQIDKAIENNAWVIFTTHVDQGDWYSDEYMREIIEYALSNGIEFVSTAEGYASHGNIAQLTKDDGISADGVPFGNVLGRTTIDYNLDITPDTPLSFFKPNTVSRYRIIINSGFPNNDSGFLDVFRYTDNPLWSYQVFTSTRSKKIYFRTWDVEEGKWSDFETHSANIYLGTNAIDFNDRPDDPKLFNRTVFSNINHQGNELFPEGKSGTLYHYGMQEVGFARQEYRVYRENKTYERWWNSSTNTWSDFKPISKTHMLPINSVSNSTKPSDFDLGITIVQASVTNDFLGGKAGVLITYTTSKNEYRYNHQEFKENGTFNKYIRYANRDNTWSEWKKYVFESI